MGAPGAWWAPGLHQASPQVLLPSCHPPRTTAIVVGCNFAAVMLVFPAVLSLDLHRRHCCSAWTCLLLLLVPLSHRAIPY